MKTSKYSGVVNYIAYAASFIINLVIAAIYWKTGNIRLETNDDVVIGAITCGTFGERSPYVFFSNVIMGRIVNILSAFKPNYNWFVLLEVFVILACYVFIAFLLIRGLGAVRGLLLSTAIELSTFDRLMGALNFTTTSSLAVVVGGIVMLFTIYRKQNHARGVHYLMLIISGMMIIVGALFRSESFLLAFPFVALAALYTVVKSGDFAGGLDAKRITSIVVKYFSCVVVILVILVCGLYHYHVYRTNPELANYQEFNSARARLTDYPVVSYDEKATEYEIIGVSRNDLAILGCSAEADYDVMDTNYINRVVALQNPPKIQPFKIIKDLSGFFGNSYAAFVSVIIFALMLEYMLFNCRVVDGVFICVDLLIVLGEIGYYSAMGRFIERVVMSTSIAGMVVAVYVLILADTSVIEECTTSDDKAKVGYMVKGVTPFAIMLLVALFGSRVMRLDNIPYYENKENLMQFVAYTSSQQDKAYVWPAKAVNLIMDCMDPFDVLPFGSMSNSVMKGGWEFTMPGACGVLKERGYDNNVYKMLAEDSEAFLVSYNSIDIRGDIDMTYTYLKEHYGENISCSMVDSQWGYDVYSFSDVVDGQEVPEQEYVIGDFRESQKEGRVVIEGSLKNYSAERDYYLNIIDGGDAFVRSYRIVPDEDGFVVDVVDEDNILGNAGIEMKIVWK